MCEDAYELLPMLLQAGADFEARDRAARTALFKHIGTIQVSRSNPTLFQTLIDLGARLDTRDFKGRTLLHQCCHQISRLDHMISLGLDPTLADYEGNTLLFEIAASKLSNISKFAFLKHLCGLGLDIDQANHRGSTVLHTLCARVETPNEHLRSLDYVLEICDNPNPCDIEGVQPLHLAATISEVYVYKLLNSGADIFGGTHEGMSALHTAARARRPNIVGFLCSKLLELGDDMRRAFVNQQNTEGQTALHLACRSGRPETVQILLEAGAEVNLMDDTELNRSLFKECAQLEAEQTLWDHIQDTYSYNAAGVLLNDTKRPCSDQDGARGTGSRSPKPHRSHWSHTVHDSIRLDVILDLLVLQDPIPLAKSRSFSFAFYEAVSNHHEYTGDCFSRLWTRMCPDIPFNHSNHLRNPSQNKAIFFVSIEVRIPCYILLLNGALRIYWPGSVPVMRFSIWMTTNGAGWQRQRQVAPSRAS
jgi:ankyrin repeat protein